MEYSYKKLDSDEIIGNGLASQDEHLRYHTFMANMYHDWFFYKKLYWYNGVGIGLALTQYDNGAGGGDDSDFTFGYQFMTGFGYEVKDRLDVYLGYRMFRTLEQSYTFNDTANNSQKFVFDSPWLFQIEAGLRIKL